MRSCRYEVSILLVLWAGLAVAEPAGNSGIRLDYQSMSPLDLPDKGDIPGQLAGFEYLDDEQPKAFPKDMNGDGAEDYVLESSDRMCGSGGCPYALIDGATGKRLGLFFGAPILVLDQRINGYPVVQAYGQLNVSSGHFVTYVFDGDKYQVVANVYIEGESVDELFKVLSSFKRMVADDTRP